MPRSAVTSVLLALVSAVLAASSLHQPAAAVESLAFPTVGWPSAWANPTQSGGSFVMTTKWGALSKGCANWDRTNGATYYLDTGTSAHTGLDMNRGDGQTVVAIADGVVVQNGQPWGASNRNVVVIEHTASSGEKFLAVYGHLRTDVVALGPITRGAYVGKVQTAGTGAHLHFGIKPGSWAGVTPNGSSASTVSGGSCTFNPVGTVDPLSYLNARTPGTGNRDPRGSLDAAQGLSRDSIRVAGWAFDEDSPTQPLNVHVYLDGPAGTGAGRDLGLARYERRDVGASFPAAGDHHGYNAVIAGIAPGNHSVFVYAINPQGGNNPLIGQAMVSVPDTPGGSPIGSLESAIGMPGRGVRLSGWALDPDAASEPDRVHVYYEAPAGDPAAQWGGEHVADLARGDIDAGFPGAGPHHGFDLALTGLSPGWHTAFVYGINAAGGGDNPLLGEREFFVPSGAPIGAFEYTQGLDNAAMVRGWAVDPDSPDASLGIHVYADGPAGSGTYVGGSTADLRRADVRQTYPTVSEDHGFENAVPLTPGRHELYVYAIDPEGQSNPLLGSRTVDVPATSAGSPLGALELAEGGPGDIRVKGWSFDPDAPTTPNHVHVYVDGPAGGGGTGIGSLLAQDPRPDVEGAHPEAGALHGFDVRLRHQTAGLHTVYAYGLDEAAPGNHVFLGYALVRVGSATIPGAPSIGGVTPGGGSMTVAFDASTQGTQADHFDVSCRGTDGGASRSRRGTASPVTVSGLTSGKSYRCRVRGTNDAGTGPWSAWSSAMVVSATVPKAPTVLTVTPSAGAVRVAFTAAASGGSPVTGYTAECRSTDRGVLGTASGTARRLLVGGLTVGRTYHCRARAANAVGNGSWSAWSTEVVVP